MIADGKVIALLADENLADRLAADCSFYRVLDITDIDPETIGGGAIHHQVHIRLTAYLKRSQVCDPGNLAHDILHLDGFLFQHLQIGAKKLDCQLALYTTDCFFTLSEIG